MKKHFTYCCFVLLLPAFGCAQIKPIPDSASEVVAEIPNLFEDIRFIPGSYTSMNVDILDNLYLITNNQQLKKINSSGDSISVFNDVKRYGNPTSVDVSNPFKILIYYKNFSTLVVLDRQLTLRSSINLRKAGIFSVKAIATSYDNQIWIFDEQDFKLKKINDEGEVVMESSDFRMLFDEVPLPTEIIDHNNFVYLYDAEKGFYIFDYFGAVKNHLSFINWRYIAVSGDWIYGFLDDKLYSYQLQSMQLNSRQLNPSMRGYLSVKAMNGKLYVLKKEGVYIHQIQ